MKKETTVKAKAKKTVSSAKNAAKKDWAETDFSAKTFEVLKNRKLQVAVGSVAAGVIAKLIYDHQHKSTPLSKLSHAKIYKAVEKFVKSKIG